MAKSEKNITLVDSWKAFPLTQRSCLITFPVDYHSLCICHSTDRHNPIPLLQDSVETDFVTGFAFGTKHLQNQRTPGSLQSEGMFCWKGEKFSRSTEMSADVCVLEQFSKSSEFKSYASSFIIDTRFDSKWRQILITLLLRKCPPQLPLKLTSASSES